MADILNNLNKEQQEEIIKQYRLLKNDELKEREYPRNAEIYSYRDDF